MAMSEWINYASENWLVYSTLLLYMNESNFNINKKIYIYLLQGKS